MNAKQLGAVLEDGLLERGFEVETLNGEGGGYYVYAISEAHKGASGHFRLTPEGDILAIGKPDRAVTKAIDDMGLGPRIGQDHKREIFVAFEIVTPESAEAGDFEETGEEGTDEIEPDYDETFADAAIKYLKSHGAYPSGGDWFESGFEVTDYRTGEEENHSYHLKGFTEDEEAEIWREMEKRR